MATLADRKPGQEEIEMKEKTAAEITNDIRSSDEVGSRGTEPTMNKAKWLACIALCLAYTTAYQQNACTSAILKQIDEKLGKSRAEGLCQYIHS